MEQKLTSPESNIDFNSTVTICVRCSIDSRSTKTEFEWVDHCPAVFRSLLEIGEVDIDDYLHSIRGPDTLKLLTSSKKSSSSLPLANDDRFIVKILTKSEMKFFLDMLPKYYRHVQEYKDTLITRFYGLHVVKPQSGQKVRFIVIGNALRSVVKIHKHYNLRISPNGRPASKVDEDLNVSFQLHKSVRLRLLAQIKNDCSFLEEVGIMNYNLQLGMHVCPASFDDIVQGRYISRISTGSDENRRSSDGSLPSPTGAAQDSASDNGSELSSPKEPEVKLGVKMTARAIGIHRKDHLRTTGKSSGNNVILYFGISNILQGYSMLRHVEEVFKSLQSESPTVPSVNPKAYSARFQEYIFSIFPENDSDASIP